jgi:hypothetical protein
MGGVTNVTAGACLSTLSLAVLLDVVWYGFVLAAEKTLRAATARDRYAALFDYDDKARKFSAIANRE